MIKSMEKQLQIEFEEWRPVVGYVGLYEVSNLGRVRNLDHYANCKSNCKRLVKGRILNQSLSNKGYYRVSLYKDNIRKHKCIHRLVAEAFIVNDDPVNKTTVNHINECKIDNRVSNLEFVTPKQNANHGTAQERKRVKISKPVNQYDLNDNYIKTWQSTLEIERELGYKHGNIWQCMNGKAKTAYGFKWKYAA